MSVTVLCEGYFLCNSIKYFALSYTPTPVLCNQPIRYLTGVKGGGGWGGGGVENHLKIKTTTVRSIIV